MKNVRYQCFMKFPSLLCGMKLKLESGNTGIHSAKTVLVSHVHAQNPDPVKTLIQVFNRIA